MYIVSNKMIKLVCNSEEAMDEFKKHSESLSEIQREKLLSSTLSKDGDDWCIFSGSDLTFDRSGFGITISDAVRDYVSVYLVKEDKIAS